MGDRHRDQRAQQDQQVVVVDAGADVDQLWNGEGRQCCDRRGDRGRVQPAGGRIREQRQRCHHRHADHPKQADGHVPAQGVPAARERGEDGRVHPVVQRWMLDELLDGAGRLPGVGKSVPGGSR